MPRLTERVVTRAKPKKAKYEISCSVLTGFMVRVLPSGKKAYYVRYRDEKMKDTRLRLGLTTELSFAEAVALATERLSGVEAPAPLVQAATARGRAGAAARAPVASVRQPAAPRVPRFSAFADRFMREHVGVRLKPMTQQTYAQFMRYSLLPNFGKLRLNEIGFADVSRFHASLVDTPHAANACLLLLSSVYSRAVEWGVLGREFTPPTRGVKKFPCRSRERFLTPEERAELDQFFERALAKKGRGGLRWPTVAAFRLLAMTGMRRDEVLDLTWDMVDYRHRCFRLPDSKTGQKIVPVSDYALELVRECRRVMEEEFPSGSRPKHVVYSKNGKRIWSSALTRTWCGQVRDRIPGLEGVRLHDLRHSLASDALMAGVPLAVVGKILGHRKPETTARYAHIADSVLSDAVQTVAEAMDHSTKTGRRLKKRR